MSLDWLSPALLAVVVVLTLWIALRRPSLPDATLERQGREMRDEVARSAQATRQELAQSLALFQQTLLAQQGDTARTQNEQIDSFSRQLAAMQQHLAEAQNAHGARQASSLKDLSDSLAARLHALVETNDRSMAETRTTVETRLGAIQNDNEKKLEQIRATVDERLHATLEQRLGESFRQVAERLDTVHRGLNDMRAIARDVGSLNRILTNVKTRGSFGEWQLGALLEDVMTLDQFARNVETIPGSGARIEFAIRMPGRADSQPLWLPIDAKFPREDYERLLDAQERADAVGATAGAVRFAPSRASHRARRTDDADRDPQQPAGGASQLCAREALDRGLGGARRGEDRVRALRRDPRQDEEEARRSVQHDRRRAAPHPRDVAPAEERRSAARAAHPVAAAARRRR